MVFIHFSYYELPARREPDSSTIFFIIFISFFSLLNKQAQENRM